MASTCYHVGASIEVTASSPPPPTGLTRTIVSRDDVEDLLIERGYCCGDQKMDWHDVKHVLAQILPGQLFRLVRVRPSRFTTRRLQSPRFKRWPIILGIAEDGPCDPRSGLTLIDGLHRCALATARGYRWVWAYVPCRPDGRLLLGEQLDAALRRECSFKHDDRPS